MGRPLKPIDADQVLKLASIGCTTEEIGTFFDVSHDTISIRFSKEMELGKANRCMSLRRMQWRSAKLGSVPMLIHLGKQYLGQSDKHDITSQGEAIGHPQIRSIIVVRPAEPEPNPNEEIEA